MSAFKKVPQLLSGLILYFNMTFHSICCFSELTEDLHLCPIHQMITSHILNTLTSHYFAALKPQLLQNAMIIFVLKQKGGPGFELPVTSSWSSHVVSKLVKNDAMIKPF